MGLARVKPHSPRGDKHCRWCNGYRTARTVCCPGRGSEGIAKFPTDCEILFVGECPATKEDKEGTVFAGSAGVVFDMFTDSFLKGRSWYVTNAVRCFLGKKPNGQLVKPTTGTKAKPGPFRACRPWLEREVRTLRPKVIVPMGQYAMAQVAGVSYNQMKVGPNLCMPLPTEWAGPDGKPIPMFSLHHPSWVDRQGIDRNGEGQGVDRWEREWEALIDFLEGRIPERPGTWDFHQTDEACEHFYRKVLFPKLQHQKTPVAYDYETTGLDPHKDDFRMVGYAWSEGEAAVCTLNTPRQRRLHRDFLEKAHIVAFHHFPMELGWGKVHFDMLPRGRALDTKVLNFLHNEMGSQKLDDLVSTYLPELAGYKRATEHVGVGHAADLPLAERCAYDCIATYRLALLFKDKLTAKQQELYVSVIEPGLRAIAHCSAYGWRFDVEQLRSLLEGCEERLEEINREVAAEPEVAQWLDYRNRMRKRAGKKPQDINLGSTHMRPELMHWLGVGREAPRRHRQANNPDMLSTSADVLVHYVDEHPLVQRLIDVSEYRHTRSHFLKPLLEAAEKYGGFIYPNYNWGGAQYEGEARGTPTGRVSCARPNLMNLPRSGESEGNEFSRKIRTCVVSRWEGGTILQADYSQLELRLMATLANEPAMIEVYREGGDLHDMTAGKMGVDRPQAKTLNFSAAYGATPEGISARNNIPLPECIDLLQGFWGAYPELEMYFSRNKRFAYVHGYLESVFGMRVHAPQLRSPDDREREHAARSIQNWPIQHTGAILTLRAMGRIVPELNRRGLVAILIAQLHDALYFDIKPGEDLEEVKSAVTTVMEDEPARLYKDWLHVPLKADFKAGKTM